MSDRAGVFLDRRGYRRRRLVDAARALPALGAFVFALPALGAGGGGAAGPLCYLLVVWAVLIALSAAVARRLSGTDGEREPGTWPPGTGPTSGSTLAASARPRRDP